MPRSRSPAAGPVPDKKPSRPAGPKPRPVPSPRHVHLGDTLKIERRYVVDGALTSVTDRGTFQGLQVLGSTEHLVIEDAAQEVRMIPLHSISEITVVAAAKRAERESFDPSFA